MQITLTEQAIILEARILLAMRMGQLWARRGTTLRYLLRAAAVVAMLVVGSGEARAAGSDPCGTDAEVVACATAGIDCIEQDPEIDCPSVRLPARGLWAYADSDLEIVCRLRAQEYWGEYVGETDEQGDSEYPRRAYDAEFSRCMWGGEY